MKKTVKINGVDIPVIYTHSIILGSGAAGLNAAVQLKRKGIDDIIILTEGLNRGTSINTGSDKQTYYKTGMCGDEKDSPAFMAESLFMGGSAHGDIALVEAAGSARAFFHLADIGVAFPRDSFGQFPGYKTDHDPLQRASSAGPYTSRDMCLRLIDEVKSLNIEIKEKRTAVSLITEKEGENRRCSGVIALNMENPSASIGKTLEIYISENLIFATGGPGGLYHTSVYPKGHTGSIGLALMEGAMARNLMESQFGIASIKFRWNVSGSYMQAIPRFISTAPDGLSDEKEFLNDYFESAEKRYGAIFLKGYQWPFNAEKVKSGSSIIDLLVYIETGIKGRRVFLDFRKNGKEFSFDELSPEASDYLEKSGALADTPFERLKIMNNPAISLYREHGIDIEHEPLEVAVCAQHNNGGLAADSWCQSENIKHLFPIGEVNGSHGIFRPGGSALNAGQVGGFRVAEYISAKYRGKCLDTEKAIAGGLRKASEIIHTSGAGKKQSRWREDRKEFQMRMSKYGAHIRKISTLRRAAEDAMKQLEKLTGKPLSGSSLKDVTEELRNRQLCFAHTAYLHAILEAAESKAGSRGSSLLVTGRKNALTPHEKLSGEWNYEPENTDFREKVLETVYSGKSFISSWKPVRPIPKESLWFETAWKKFRKGEIYN